VAFRSLATLVTALTLSSTSSVMAEETIPSMINNQNEATISNNKLNLDLELKLATPPRIDIATINRCPEPFVEVTKPPKILDILPFDDPRYQLVIDIFAGEKSLDLAYDDLREAMLGRPFCTLPIPEILKPQKRQINEYFGPKSSVGAKTLARIELPGTERKFQYRLFGKNNNRIVNDGAGIEFDINHQLLYWKDNIYSVPRLNQSDIYVGDSSLSTFRKDWRKFPQARKELENILENLVNGVSGALDNRQVEIFINWGAFFREILPEHFNDEGLLIDWQELSDEVKNKANDFYGTLKTGEKESLDTAVTNFRNDFNRLQNRNPLTRTAWQVLNADNPACVFQWGGIPFCEAYQMLESFGPDLVEINKDQGRLEIIINPLNTSFHGFSANFHSFYDSQGNSITLSGYSGINLQAIGRGHFRGELTEGEEAESFLPEKYKDELGLLESILGRSINIVDAAVQARLGYALAFSNQRLQGLRLSFFVDDLNLGIIKNQGFEYQLNSSGFATFDSLASSQNNILYTNFSGELKIEQLLRYHEEFGLDIFKKSDKWWYTANILAQRQNVVKKTEIWGASWRYTVDYESNEQQNAFSSFSSKYLDRWQEFSLVATARGGLNLTQNLELNISGNKKGAGFGFFTDDISYLVSGQCHSSGNCKLSTKIPILGELNRKETKKHHVKKQQLTDSVLVGKESLQQAEEYRHQLALLSKTNKAQLFLGAEFQHFFETRFPHWNKNSGKFGLTLVDIVDGVKTYTSLNYLGNFIDMHGASFDFGTEELFIKLTYAEEINKSRKTNTTTAGLETTLDLGGIKVTQKLELFPASNDFQPHYKKTKKGWKKKYQGDFQFLAQVRGEGDFFQKLLYGLLVGEITSLEWNFFSLYQKSLFPQKLGSEIIFGYQINNVSIQNQAEGKLSSETKRTFEYKADLIFDALYGIGPAVLTKLGNDLVNDRVRLLPGIGLQGNFGHHNFRTSLAMWDRDGVVADLRTSYLYNDQESKDSFYLRAQAASFLTFGLNQEPLFESKEASAEIYLGIRKDKILLTAYGKSDLEDGLSVGFKAGLILK
jgi:hypothetical protein